MNRLFSFGILGFLLVSCSTIPRVEEIDPGGHAAHAFYIRNETGITVRLVCRKLNADTIEFGMSVENRSYLKRKLTDWPTLNIDGKAVETAPAAGELPEITHGSTWSHTFQYRLSTYNPREANEKQTKTAPCLVYAQAGTFVTPTVWVDLALDSRVPVRFAEVD